MNRLLLRVCALLLCLTVGLVPALAEETAADDGKIHYIAKAHLSLKMRVTPESSANGNGSIREGEDVYIIALDSEWCKVKKRNVGYVLTKYLDDVRAYDEATGTVGEPVEIPAATQYAQQTATETADDDFYAGYKAFAVKPATIYKEPDEKSGYAGKVPIYDEVTVSRLEGEWCYIRYGKRYGYTRISNLFKWDKLDPYVGNIPGCIIYPYIAFANASIDIIDYETLDKKKPTVLKTINPGAAFCVEEPDENGVYKTPYWRKTGCVTQSQIAYLQKVVPWAQAMPGDLVSVMTTYYAVGVHTLQYQGRNYNIYLGTTRISGTVVKPGEQFNMNQVMGPYRKSSGFHLAPIMSPVSSEGYGGGTCQVNTTVYNTLIQLPILVNHRKVHSNVGAKYFLKGFDAAVGGGDINMIFTNTMPYAIRLEFFMSDGVLTCCIYRAQ